MFVAQLIALIIGLAAAVVTAQSPSPSGGSDEQDNYIYGFDYGVNMHQCPSYEQYYSDFKLLKQYTNRVRIFSLSVCDQGPTALQAANDLDMDIYLGMWIDRPDTFDSEMNALQNMLMDTGLKRAITSHVDGIIVGSEVLYRNDTDVETFVKYIDQVKQAVQPYGIKVATADVYYKFPPEVIEKVDMIMMNAFPYWEGVPAQEATATLLQHYEQVTANANGKPVLISETGWPSAGDSVGAAIASPENQITYLTNTLCETHKKNISMLWFSAFDEPYKQGVEQNWGIHNSSHMLKEGITVDKLKKPCP